MKRVGRGGAANPDAFELRSEVVAAGVTVAAIILFAGTAGSYFADLIRRMLGSPISGNLLMMIALLLNIALIMLGWRRYRDLTLKVADSSAATARAQALAYTDPLTGFPNRRALDEAVSAMLDDIRGPKRAVALMMIDLDHFKAVNDLHGHVTGDKVLRAAARVIEEALPPGAAMARLGGDEFACAVPFDAVDPRPIDTAAARIVERLGQPFAVDGVQAHISGSLGIARSDHEAAPQVDALLRRADIAMYAAKRSGRRSHAWFDESMARELKSRNTVEDGLRHAIPTGQVVPFYEPQIDLATGRIDGFEVLARWLHPTDGVIGPNIFIPVAEETGLIGALSLSIMRQAFEEARNWDPGLTLAVNISPGQLKDPWLAQKIVKLLDETGYPPERLEIEITESALFENLELAQSIIASLKAQGIRLALDDFGTGYSSLAHLRALPFDRIKIDRSFVIAMLDDPESASIVDAITKLGGSLGLPITAEGIETAAIETRLRAIGCHKGQGWHFGKPMPVTAVRRLLAERGLMPTARMFAAPGGPLLSAG